MVNTQLENLINPAPLTSHTQTNPGQSPLITPPNQTPLRPTTETVPPPNQNGNSSVNLSGRLVSNDWLDNKNLAEAIRKAMKEAIKDAVQNDPQFKSMNLTLNIKKIDLSTPQHPSSDLKGIEVTSNDPDKKINFTATPEGISGNSNTENLKAMSIEIVKNLEIRILHGATDLKINLGDCHPESVKKEFSELINKQLENMLQKNQGKPQFNNYSMEKLKLPITPSVSGVIAPTNPMNDTSTQQRRLSSSL